MYKKNQHILLLIQQLNPNKNALKHALKIADIFKSKVLISKSPFTKNSILEKDLTDYISGYENIDTLQLGVQADQPNRIIKELNIIFMFIELDKKNDFKFYLKKSIFSWILNAKIPTFIIGSKTTIKADYSNIILPIDCKKESKEKMIWASYFGRFNKANIQLITATEKEDSFMKTIRNTLVFTKKMFAQFIFNYRIHKSECSSKHIDEEAFRVSTTKESDLVVLMTGKTQGIFFLRYNSSKIKHYLNTYPNPILLINPMKDYYLPCDS